MTFTPRQTATVLFSLRLYQSGLDVFKPTREAFSHFNDEEPLNKDEIDDLCEAINFDDVDPLTNTDKDKLDFMVDHVLNPFQDSSLYDDYMRAYLHSDEEYISRFDEGMELLNTLRVREEETKPEPST